MQKRQHHRGGDPGQEPDPDEARGIGDGGGKKRRDQHLALKPDVENARAFRPQPGETGEQKRCGQPDGAVKDLQDGQEIHVLTPPGWGARRHRDGA